MRIGMPGSTSSRALHTRVCSSYLLLSLSGSGSDIDDGVCGDHLLSLRSACEPGGGLLNPGGGHDVWSAVITGCFGGSSVMGEYDRSVELK